MDIHGLAPRPTGPDQCPNPGSSRAEDRARIRVNGGSRPPFLVDAAHPPTWSERSRSSPVPRRRRAAAHPRARLLAARPRGTRQKPQPTRGTKPRPADRSEGRTMNSRDRPLVVRGSGPLSSCCWSSPGPPCRSGPPAATRGADAMTRRSTRRVNGLGGVQGTVAPPRSDRGNSGERRTGGAVAAWAERSRV